MERKDHNGREKERVHDNIDSDVGSEEDKSMEKLRSARERERGHVLFFLVCSQLGVSSQVNVFVILLAN